MPLVQGNRFESYGLLINSVQILHIKMNLKFFDIYFTVLHALLILFNLFGWKSIISMYRVNMRAIRGDCFEKRSLGFNGTRKIIRL